MKRFGRVALWFVLATQACNPAPVAVKPPTTAPMLPNVSLVGRFDLRDPNAARCAWPGSQIRARFSGPWIRATLTDTPTDREPRETDWIEVMVDDQPPRTFQLAEGRHVYPLARDLTPGEHEITIWKRTEALVGTITFHELTVAAGNHIGNVAAPSRHIEAVGDSITAGYGNEGRNAACSWSARRENNHQTYPAVAARLLDASYTAIAWSGKGVTRNNDPRETLTLPALYARVIPTEDDSPLAANTPVPDAYVVNLGTNDMFAGLTDEDAFRRDYSALLKTLRTRAPNAWIVIALGPMLYDEPPRTMQRTQMRTWLAAIEADWRSNVDERITSIELWTDPAEGVGCNVHPNKKTHHRLGAELAALLRDRLGW